MAWKETCIMDQKMCFIARCLEGHESISELCRHFGVSRKTGHKWLKRYSHYGVLGLEDRSRRPLSNPRRVPDEVADAILKVRLQYGRWGPRKVKAWLESHYPDRPWPAASTIGALFDRAGLTEPRKKRRRVAQQSYPFENCRKANDVWCVDFKGWFLTGDGTRVDPLTISDGFSRYLIDCQAVGRADTNHVWPLFDAAFREYGLPLAIRSDNGAPFASCAAGGLSRLSVKWIKAGIRPERIEPGKPQQNGRHERMHLTLKQETATPPARSLREQMDRFEHFRKVYNNERPHEALGQVPPIRFHHTSPRRYDGVQRSPDYTDDAVVRRVRSNGEIKWKGSLMFISEVLCGEPIGLLETDNDVWTLKYGPVVLGTVRGEDGFQRLGAGSRSRPKPYRR